MKPPQILSLIGLSSATALLAGMTDGASIIAAAFVGDDLVFTRDDAETIPP